MKRLPTVVLLLTACVISALLFTACGKSSSGDTVQTEATPRYVITVYDGRQAIHKVYYDPKLASDFSLPIQSKQGKIFKGYADSDGILCFDANGCSVGYLIESDLNLYCKWESQKYNLSLNAEGGTLSEREKTVIPIIYETDVPDLPVPEKEGFDFLGWANEKGVLVSDADGRILESKSVLNVSNYPLANGSNDTVWLHAQYDVMKLVVTLDYSYDRKDQITVNYNESLNELPVEDDGSRILVGWAYNAYERRENTFLGLENITEDKVIYAIYIPYRTITLVYTEDCSEQVKVFQDQGDYKLVSDDTIADKNPGYYCTGWYTDPAFSGSAKVSSAYYSDRTSIFYAKWEKQTYEITLLDENGATYENGQYDRTYRYGDAFALPVLDDTEEFEFLGWGTEDGKVILESVTETTYGTFTLRPIWRRYTSTFDLYVDDKKTESVEIAYRMPFELAIPASIEPEQFRYWYFKDGEEIVPVTDENGRSLSDWQEKDGTFRVYAKYLSKCKVELTFLDPQTQKTVVKDVGYRIEGKTVTIAKPVEIGNSFDVRGWYVDGELKSDGQSYTFEMPDHAIRIEVRYSIPVADFTMFGYPAYKLNGHYYAFIPKTASDWNRAQSICALYGGHLVTITGQEENDFVFDLLKREGYSADYSVFLGATDRDSEGNWKWVTGETFGYKNFVSGEPNGGTGANYLQIYKSYYSANKLGWDDTSDGKAYFICEWDSAEKATVIDKILPNLSGKSEKLEIFKYNGHYYSGINQKTTWLNAEKYAESLGAHLVTISDAAENHFVDQIKYLTLSGNVHIGLTDYFEEGKWEWVTGESVNYTNWKSGEPNNSGNQDFAQHVDYEYWDDVGETNLMFVIEWDDYADIGAEKSWLYGTVPIRTADDLMRLNQMHVMPEAVFVLMNDIDMEGVLWTPRDFGGNLDGNGYSIKNLWITSTSGSVGMFNKITGSVKNLNFEELMIESSSNDKVQIGGLAAYSTATVENVNVLSGSIVGNACDVAGLVAYVQGGEVRNCKNYATVSGESGGGVAGVVEFLSAGKVTKCENYGAVTGKATRSAGVVADIEGNTTVSDCKNFGKVAGNENVAGVVGYIRSSATVSALSNAGEITASGNCAGGVIGSANYGKDVAFDTLVNTGKITGKDYTGGIVGYLKDSNCAVTVNNWTNSGAIVGGTYTGGVVGYCSQKKLTANEWKNTGNVTGATHVGGLVGYAYAGNSESLIRNSSSKGAVTGEWAVGGLAGQLDTIRLSNSTNAGSTVTATGYKIDGSNYYAYLGGYVGYAYSVENCENAAELIYTEYGGRIGGIAGYANGAINACKNTADITATKSSGVGGIVGCATYDGDVSFANLENTGNVTGKDNTGGIVGYLKNASYSVVISKWTNGGTIVGGTYTGGVIGFCSQKTIMATSLNNTANIAGNTHVGGLVGYAASNGNSTIKDSASSGAVSGEWAVGGLAGQLDKIRLANSTNAGSSVTATGYKIDGSSYYAYLGGYVGYGYSFENCENASALTYTERGEQIGGIAGYASGPISACKNTADITATKSNKIGGIAGYATYGGDVSYMNLENTGKITGKDYTGGIVGYYANSSYIVSIGKWTNGGAIVGSSYAAGLMGYGNLKKLTASDLKNTGDVTGTVYVGGLIGYAYSNATDSLIWNSSSKGSITGEWVVGGLAGELERIRLSDSTNAGSTVTATGYKIDGSNYYAYLGGYVGYAYSVENCENAAELIYTEYGGRIGGIAGYANGAINACKNTADITATKSSGVGGIVGCATYDGDVSFANLENTGNVTGKDNTGGIVGYLKNASYSVVISKWTNGGTIVGGTYTGGVIGYCSQKKITATDMKNTGNVTGTSYVGGVIGYAYSNSNTGSRIVSPESTGTVQGTGDYVNSVFGKLDNISVEE